MLLKLILKTEVRGCKQDSSGAQ